MIELCCYYLINSIHPEVTIDDIILINRTLNINKCKLDLVNSHICIVNTQDLSKNQYLVNKDEIDLFLNVWDKKVKSIA